MSTQPRSPRPVPASRLAGCAVAALTLLAIAIRLHALEHQPLWSDEGLSLHRAGLGLLDLLRGRIVVDGFATTDPMPPLYFLALAAGRFVLGAGIWAQRFVGAALGVTAVPLAWVAGRRLFGRGAGIAAAIVIAVAPFVVWYGQELRPYAVVIPCVLALTALAAGHGDPTARARRWAAASAVGVLVHPFVGFVALAQAPFVLPSAWRRAAPRRRWAAAAIAGAAALVALPRLAAILGGPTQVDFAPVDALVVMRQALAAFAVGISPSLDHPIARSAPLALLAIAGAGVGLSDARTRRGAALTIAGLALPIVGVLCLSAVNPLYNGPRHVLPALPAFALLVGASARLPTAIRRGFDRRRPDRRGLDQHGLDRRGLHQRGLDQRGLDQRGGAAALPLVGRTATIASVASVGSVAALLAAATMGLAVSCAQLQRQFGASDYVKDDLRSLVADLAVRYVPGDRIVLHDALIGFTFDAEAAALGVVLPWVPVPHFPNEDRHAAEARLLAMVPAAGGRVWFVDRPSPRGGFEGESLVQAADKRWDLVERRQYARMWLRVGLREYRVGGWPTQVSPRAATGAIVTWSNGLALNDAAFERPTVAAGQRLGLVTRWQPHAPLAGEVDFEVRLRDAQHGRAISLGADQLLRDRDLEDTPPGSIVEIALRAGVPIDTPPGPHDVQLRIRDARVSSMPVEPGANGSDDKSGPDENWRSVARVDVGPPVLAPLALRRLARRETSGLATESPAGGP
ncbi:MAG: glycosyltransferase family 39 protein [Ardenticatenales bacterium]|nr:glycosyltransferase family 39 protein [Ardenticatenales bacterium]